MVGNPLDQVRLERPVRPHPVIWTDERVAAWRRDGIRPPVAVWTLRQLITFLTGVENDRLAALWWLIALRGLRRGEAAALDRDDLDSEARELTISRQLVALPGELYCGPPKSRASVRTMALDEDGTRRLADQAVKQAVELLRHRFTDQRRSDARVRTGPGWRRGRAMFTYADGRPVQPEYLTHRFNILVKEFDLPPIRLHDLRHGAATLALASPTDLKVIQQMLGHSSIVTTADTYTSVLPETAHRAAQATANMVMKAARSAPGSRAGRLCPTSRPPSPPPATARCEFPQKQAHGQRFPANRAGASSWDEVPARTQECPIHAPQRRRPYSPQAIRPGQYGCAARDLNPEPAD